MGGYLERRQRDVGYYGNFLCPSHALKRKESTKKRPGGKRRMRGDGGRRLRKPSNDRGVSSDYSSFTRPAPPLTIAAISRT